MADKSSTNALPTIAEYKTAEGLTAFGATDSKGYLESLERKKKKAPQLPSQSAPTPAAPEPEAKK